MKNLITIITTALLSWLATWYLPWWMIAVVPFVVAVATAMKPGRGFLIGFISIAVLWLYLIFNVDIANDHILTTRMATLFGLPSYGAFIAVNVFIGGLIGGLGGWCGASMNKLRKKK